MTEPKPCGIIFGGDGFAQITGRFEPITLTGESERMICDNCMGNPKINPYASGFCNCALPAMERGGGWFQGGRTQTEKTFVTSNFVTSVVGTLTIPALKKRYKCEYCDTITEEPGNCKNCGAPVVEVE